MAITFRRGRHAAPSFADVVRELPADWTGAVHASVGNESAAVYLFEGGVYAAGISGFSPDIAQRLASSGWLGVDQVQSWRAAELAGSDPEAQALEHGWCSIDQLNVVHQEFVVATVGAIAGAADVLFEPIGDEVTAAHCCMPLPANELLAVIDKRRERLRSEALALASQAGINGADGAVEQVSAHPWIAVPGRDAGTVELAALVGAFDIVRALDSAAAECGFTRAEAVHLAGVAAVQGLLALAPESALPGSFSTQIDVPEAWPPVA